ncbi:response regulator [Nostoc flagelliforme FACHB-838]|uniref:Response regulator n=1 Tax=Nostoc flagelliforme FACHB-838 TaxID=2692904 RepID=A0ABR8DTC3_9NOSO|nr:response regulator [Nostoc flagelliforme]MBD2532413.1 response regulator [Nostoc flagelliforme FACHB-838]
MTLTSAFPMQQTPLLLVVEDSNEDFEALQRFLGRSAIAIAIHRCVNGEQALAFLYRTDSYVKRESLPRPGLIVLDLNLPGTDGREVLRRIKQDDKLKMIPVVVFTTSNNPKDIEVCYRYGVNSYIVKPINFAQLKRNIQMLVEYWFEVTRLPDCPED